MPADNELEAWRLQETRSINDELASDEAARLDALQQLLLKEQKLLQTIDRLRLQADDENRDKRIRSTLQLMSAPKRWQVHGGHKAGRGGRVECGRGAAGRGRVAGRAASMTRARRALAAA